ncbi:MAG: MarR family winged helix-turn-helix transcriptional regulator [Gemmatimonadaceae bacterium]
MTSSEKTDVLDEIEAALTQLTRNPRIRGIHRILNAEAGVELDRPTNVALAMLEDGPLRISDLADACGVDTSTMSRLIERLSARGFVERSADPQDRRAALIEASEGGRAVQRQLRAFREESLKKMLSDWKPIEREQFALLLSRFVGDADELMREHGL